ncbi:MAG: hypothetical protein KAS32_04150 [Candidatus Peribacteraceae bacterium]|nr:hypothetical protein [Candidatus Peribacteraceae bacterium]
MYNKIKTIIEKGGLDVVVQRDDYFYCIFSTISGKRSIRYSGWYSEIKLCKYHIGNYSILQESIERLSKSENWKIIKTIARESHYAVGDKVRVRLTGEVEEITNSNYSFEHPYATNTNIYHSGEIEPYFPEEQEKMVTIEISKKSLEGIKNYKIIK